MSIKKVRRRGYIVFVKFYEKRVRTVAIWVCQVCDFVYDEEEGLPSEGIPPGTAWEDIPADWRCPDCGVGKDSFEMERLYAEED